MPILFDITNDRFPPYDTSINGALSSYRLFAALVLFMNISPILQENSDFLLCRGEVEEKIFSPWLQSLEMEG